MKFARKALSVILIFSHVLLFSCNDNPVDPAAQQPDLPPLESMNVNFALFDNTRSLPKTTGATPGPNFFNAALRLGIINIFTVAVMAIPVATFGAAISQSAERGENGQYHWTYTVPHRGSTLSARLTGYLDLGTSESVWEMRITDPTADPPLADFLWYTGRARFDNTSGDWHIFDHEQPGANVEVLQIDWTHTAEDQSSLKFTVVKPAVEENGDMLTYIVDGDARSVRLFDNSASASIIINWDEPTGAGDLTAPGYNGGQKACWGPLPDLADRDCTS